MRREEGQKPSGTKASPVMDSHPVPWLYSWMGPVYVLPEQFTVPAR
jgi:hypothetical protein